MVTCEFATYVFAGIVELAAGALAAPTDAGTRTAIRRNGISERRVDIVT